MYDENFISYYENEPEFLKPSLYFPCCFFITVVAVCMARLFVIVHMSLPTAIK